MPNEKIHIERNTVQETLIIPLFARKICTEQFSDFFTDEKAMELMNRLDYDFSDVEKSSQTIIQRFGALEVAARQKAFGFEVEEYLKEHPSASVVNLGCGLDQYIEKFDNGKCKFYNIDFPDIIEIREKLIEPSERVINISTDLNDQSWFKKVDRDNGAIFFGSGVFYYFTAEQVKKLVNGMAEYFHEGVLLFDIASKKASETAIKTWIRNAGIDNVMTYFYVNSLDEHINPWLKNATASYRRYMTGYFDLKEKSIPSLFRNFAKFIERVMKMKIIKIEFYA